MKNKIKTTKTKLYNHIHKVKKRHVEKFLHTWAHTHHTLIHLGELIIVGAIGAFTILHASYDNSYQHLYRESSIEISKAFSEATEQEKPRANQSKVISIWKETRIHIENTFFPGYCTWGAALISPEFFPFTSEYTQQRTRGGNAVDRCSGANATGYQISSNPSLGSLIVYKGTSSNGYFGHVGKVMYHNKKHESMIIRDMNRLSKYTRTDRREDTKNTNIKCYIYPKKIENNIPSEQIKPTENNDKFAVNTDNLQSNTTNKPSTTENQIIIQKPNTGSNTTIISLPNNQTHNSAPEEEKIIQEPENNNLYKEVKDNIEEEILIEQSKDFSDITNHFLSQYEMKIIINKKNNIKIGESVSLKINIINKETKEYYQGILPFVFNSISQNDILESSLKTVQFIHNNENSITFKAVNNGESAILLTIGDQKIKTINIFVR